jgi:hypothetical protein
MPHPEKKRRLLHSNDAVVAISDFLASFDDLGVDVLANIYGFLPIENIMCSRRINKKSVEAVKKTIVPITVCCFCVESVEDYEDMRVMTRVIPNLQQIELRSFRDDGHKWSDGEDPIIAEWLNDNTDWIPHDIEIISNFSKLRILNISHAKLNGKYPDLFNFPLLQKLKIRLCFHLKFDLGMLAGLPVLRELECSYIGGLTGNINSLRALKGTLEKVDICYSDKVEGNLKDLADFPHLKELNLYGTAVTGDIRDIGEHDFPSLELLILPKWVYGISGYEIWRISDGPELIRAVYRLKKQRPALIDIDNWYGKLSEDSPDWYEPVDDFDYPPPFFIRLVEAGSRVGYRWTTNRNDDPCEVNWLDPEPDRGSSDYKEYIEELESIENEVGMYRGFHQPPSEEEYRSLTEG